MSYEGMCEWLKICSSSKLLKFTQVQNYWYYIFNHIYPKGARLPNIWWLAWALGKVWWAQKAFVLGGNGKKPGWWCMAGIRGYKTPWMDRKHHRCTPNSTPLNAWCKSQLQWVTGAVTKWAEKYVLPYYMLGNNAASCTPVRREYPGIV